MKEEFNPQISQIDTDFKDRNLGFEICVNLRNQGEPAAALRRRARLSNG
jgi:hypothetical protein